MILVAAVAALGYAVSVLGYVLWAPDIGVRCAFTPVVNHFYPEYLDPPDQPTPLQPGDRIVQVDDQRVENWPQLLRHLGEREGRHSVVVHFQRGDEAVHTATCRLGRPPLDNLIPSVSWFFLKVGLFVVGAVVFWKRPDDRAAAQFFVLCSVSLVAYMGGYHFSRIVTQPLLLFGFMACAFVLPAAFLHFNLLFPRPKAWLQRAPHWALLVIYGPPLVFLGLLTTGYLRVRWLDHSGSPEAVRLLLGEMLGEVYVYFGIAVLWFLASIACLVHSYRRAENVTERNQVKWILFGSLAALAPIGYSLYLAMCDQWRFGGGGATWPMFAASVCVTAAFTISITRYRLLQLDQILSSGVVYFLISCLAGLAYYGLVFVGWLLVGSRFIAGPSLGQALWVSSTALVMMLALDLARSRVKALLDRHFRREKRQLDTTLQQMSQAIEQLVDPPTLARRLLHTAAELLAAPNGAVYLRRGEPPLYLLTDAIGPAPALNELSSGCPLVEALRDQTTLMARRRGASADPAQRQLQFLGADAAHALTHEGQFLGLLLLGPKPGGPYTTEDLNLLSAVAQLSVLALVSAEGRRTIEDLNRELQSKVEKIAEQQRRILFLQSQLNARRAIGVKDQIREDKKDKEDPVESTNGAAPSSAAPSPSADGLVGSSPQVRQLMHLVRRVAASPSAVLLRGESGTGKELLARALHENSPRAGKPFVKVNCAALAPSLLESELFGHVKGAFTNAIKDKVGRFEAAHGGTLFLDEIGDLDVELQVKLLRVLQERTFERVGSSEPSRVDVRLIAATHQDLEALMRQGRFRDDLFYRLNVISIAVPPLRDRVEDVAELATHFIRLHAARAGREPPRLDDDALAVLKAYPWPGNIRQLENVMERAVVIAEVPVIAVGDLPDEVLAAADAAELPEGEAPFEGDDLADEEDLGLAAFDPTGPVLSLVQSQRAERERREREQLVRALAAAGGNKAEAARALGVARSTLVSRLKRLGLS